MDIFRKADTMSNMEKSGGRRARRIFSDEFRAGAVRLVLDEGKTVGSPPSSAMTNGSGSQFGALFGT